MGPRIGIGDMCKAMYCQGFTYLGLLFMIAILGTTLAAGGTLWSAAQQRENERDLLFIGAEFRKGIASYYERTPGTVKRYPLNMSDLLRDNRHLAMVRHVRRIYIDPMTKSQDWGIVRAPDGGIMGIYSLSDARPIKRSEVQRLNIDFEKASKYSDWKFFYEPPTVVELNQKNPSIGSGQLRK
ncbi:hypothetical protein D3C87_926660 [compost metagenome]